MRNSQAANGRRAKDRFLLLPAGPKIVIVPGQDRSLGRRRCSYGLNRTQHEREKRGRHKPKTLHTCLPSDLDLRDLFHHLSAPATLRVRDCARRLSELAPRPNGRGSISAKRFAEGRQDEQTSSLALHVLAKARRETLGTVDAGGRPAC